MHSRSGIGILMAALLVASVAACTEDGDGDGTGPEPELNPVRLDTVATGLVSPVALVAPDTTLRFVVDQVGQIWVLHRDDSMAPVPFLDLRSRMVSLSPQYDERGLLGLAFHPNYRTNGRFYVYYSAPLRTGAPSGWNHTARISEFRVSPNSAERADLGSERVILEIDKPQANHNGGTLAFGPDGFLYVSIGDGGGANDVGPGHVEDWFPGNGGGNAQSIESLLGKILRIDVNLTGSYTSPPSNPFVNRAGRDEIYAYGFRNPYRFSFDRSNGDLFAGDGGENRYEEIDKVTLGGNYGWNVFEGAHCFDAELPSSVNVTGCPAAGQFNEPFVPPVIEYPQTKLTGGRGVVVIGGFMYRGNDVEALRGKYVFGDFSKTTTAPDGTIFVATPGLTPWEFSELLFPGLTNGRIAQFVRGFGQDARGELYVLTSGNLGPSGVTGRVFKLID